MIDTPELGYKKIGSNEHTKIISFIFIALACMFFLVGIIPAIITFIFTMLARKNREIDYISKGLLMVKIYSAIVIVIFSFFAFTIGGGVVYPITTIMFIIGSMIPFILYCLAYKYLFLNPLVDCKEYFFDNGLFPEFSKKK